MDELLDRAPCGFVSFTDEGAVVSINGTLLEMLGYRREEVVGRKVEALLSLSSRIFYQTHFFPLLRLHEKAEEIFLSLRPRTGEDVPVLANAVRREEGGRFVSHCVFMPVHQRRKYEDEILQAKRDAEEALRSNEELVRTKAELERHAREMDRQISALEQRNRELAQLSHILSHDLREPLRKITLFTDVLYEENEGRLTPDGVLSVERINSAASRMSQLLSSLEEYLLIDGRGGPLQKVDLDEVAEGMRAQVSRRTGVELQLTNEGLPVIEGYRRQLALLFYHLFENAVKFRKRDEPPVVVLSSVTVQSNLFKATQGRYSYVDYARIAVADNGIGFDPKYSGYVFEILKKLDPAVPGLGVGLALCKKVVDWHHGSIEVASEPGKGTRFTLLLPLELGGIMAATP